MSESTSVIYIFTVDDMHTFDTSTRKLHQARAFQLRPRLRASAKHTVCGPDIPSLNTHYVLFDRMSEEDASKRLLLPSLLVEAVPEHISQVKQFIIDRPDQAVIVAHVSLVKILGRDNPIPRWLYQVEIDKGKREIMDVVEIDVEAMVKQLESASEAVGEAAGK